MINYIDFSDRYLLARRALDRTAAKMKSKSYILNMGPVHPSLHGVLRLITEIEGERIKKVDPHIGLLHRGTEKLMESKTYLQGLPYMDRLDYVSMMAQEHCFCLAIEDLLNVSVDPISKAIRVLFLEITRILNHLLAITTHAMDVGALTPFLWAFEEREKLMGFYEEVSGARMHAAYIRVGGVSNANIENLIPSMYTFVTQFPSRIDELEELLSENRIWIGRTMDIGKVSKEEAIANSMSGPLIRGSNIPWDLRKTTPYEIYKELNFQVVVGQYGDCFDRYQVRMNEMRESCKIIHQVLDRLNIGYIIDRCTSPYETSKKERKQIKNNSMEDLITHFKHFAKGIRVPKGLAYASTEAPKGEFSILLISDGSEKIDRCSIKTPGFVHLRTIDMLSKEKYIADLITNLGTLDIVLGECDR